jgi:hypothetical protein
MSPWAVPLPSPLLLLHARSGLGLVLDSGTNGRLLNSENFTA